MRNWRFRRGGRKPEREQYLTTRLGLLVDDWLKDQRRRGLTKSTVETRRLLLRRFLQWCAMRNVGDPQWLSPGLLQSWIHGLDDYLTRKQKPLAESSKEGMLRAVNAFMNFLLERQIIESNPFHGYRIRRCRGRRIPNVMDESEVAALLVEPDTSDLLGIRDRAILELLYSSGLRRRELAFVQMGDVRINAGVLIVRHGKGGKERIVPIGRVATYWLKRYLEEVRPMMLVEDSPNDYVFLTCYGDRFSVGYLGVLVRKYLDQIGLKMSGACHLLRHACATHMLDHGSDLRVIQTLLGHSRVDTTEIYTFVSTDRVCKAHHAAHPRG